MQLERVLLDRVFLCMRSWRSILGIREILSLLSAKMTRFISCRLALPFTSLTHDVLRTCVNSFVGKVR